MDIVDNHAPLKITGFPRHFPCGLQMYPRFSRDVTAAMLVYRTIAKKVFWEFDSVIMQNLGDILPLFCTPTWPSHHVSENQELTRKIYKGNYIRKIATQDNNKTTWSDISKFEMKQAMQLIKSAKRLSTSVLKHSFSYSGASVNGGTLYLKELWRSCKSIGQFKKKGSGAFGSCIRFSLGKFLL